MKIAYVDDNLIERNDMIPLLRSGLRKQNIQLERIDCFDSGRNLLQIYEEGIYDLILLDIFLPEENGLDIAKKIRNIDTNTRIAFCSTSNDFANESYTVDACYYMLKPVTPDLIDRMIHRLRLTDEARTRSLILPNGHKLILNDIIGARYRNHRVDIYMKNGTMCNTWMSFSNFVDLLKNYSFLYQVNSGSLINFNEVTNMEKDSFTMSDNTVYQIARRRRSEIQEAYRNHLFASVRLA